MIEINEINNHSIVNQAKTIVRIPSDIKLDRSVELPLAQSQQIICKKIKKRINPNSVGTTSDSSNKKNEISDKEKSKSLDSKDEGSKSPTKIDSDNQPKNFTYPNLIEKVSEVSFCECANGEDADQSDGDEEAQIDDDNDEKAPDEVADNQMEQT